MYEYQNFGSGTARPFSAGSSRRRPLSSQAGTLPSDLGPCLTPLRNRMIMLSPHLEAPQGGRRSLLPVLISRRCPSVARTDSRRYRVHPRRALWNTENYTMPSLHCYARPRSLGEHMLPRAAQIIWRMNLAEQPRRMRAAPAGIHSSVCSALQTLTQGRRSGTRICEGRSPIAGRGVHESHAREG